MENVFFPNSDSILTFLTIGTVILSFRSKLLLIELIPHLTIVILNSFILIKIVKSSKFRFALHPVWFTVQVLVALHPVWFTGPPDRMSHRKWRESKQQLI